MFHIPICYCYTVNLCITSCSLKPTVLPQAEHNVSEKVFRTLGAGLLRLWLKMSKTVSNITDLSLLVTTQLKVLASLDGQHSLGPAVGLHTLQPQHNFLCSLGLKRQTANYLF